MSTLLCTAVFLTLWQAELPGKPTPKDTVESYAAIDERLRGEYLLSDGAVWRYQVGLEEPINEEPSKKKPYLDWTKLEYYDSDWSEGTTPMGYGAEGLATTIEGMEGNATTVYMRHILDVYDPEMYEDVEFRCQIDDGYVFFVNGSEQDRQHAGILLHVTNETTASSPRTIDRLPIPEDEMNGALKAGPNPLALIGLVYKDDRESFQVRPRIYGTFRKNEEEDRLRGRRVRKRLAGDRLEPLNAYLDARLLQRLGRYQEATALFMQAARADAEELAPWQRQVECAQADGFQEALAKSFEATIKAGVTSVALLDTYARLVLEDLGDQAARLARLADGAEELPSDGYFADGLWAAQRVLAEEPLRIDCGADTDRGSNGSTWSRDRLHTYGRPAAAAAGEGFVRVAERLMGQSRALYRIPVPAGFYDLRLSFQLEPSDAVDVLVNGVRARRTMREGNVSIPVRTHTNWLEIDLVARTDTKATIAGIEVWPVDAEGFQTLATSWLKERGNEDTYALVQRAEAHRGLDHPVEALAAYEQAEVIPGFSIEAREQLGALRDSLLPNLFTYASADDFAVRRSVDASFIARAANEAASNEREEFVALYLEGRIHQSAGRLDDATIIFEELAFSGNSDPEPFLRMAECLKEAALAPEAEDILRTAVESDVPITPAFLRLWISMALDDLDRDPWEVVADLAQLPVQLPEYFAVLPTSEEAPRAWRYLPRQPPTVLWSQTSFGALDWFDGLAPMGWGSVRDTSMQTTWEGAVMYARTPLNLPGKRLLYPHARVSMNDAGDVYLNGTVAHRLRGRTSGYDIVPMRKGNFQKGDNFVGFYAFNIWDQSNGDVGVVEPLGLLVWIQRTLAQGAIRINCGGSEYTDATGQLWHGDRFFAHGSNTFIVEGEDSPPIKDTDDDELYRSQRSFSTRHTKASFYHLPIPDGKYSVTMHFAESDPRFNEEDKRLFSVKLETVQVMENFDATKELGYATAGSRTFETTVTDGWLDIDFVHVKDKAFVSISALEILPVQ